VLLLFDTSVYVDVLRDGEFARQFRPRYARDLPRTHFSAVVVQELLAGARTAWQRRQAAALFEPFERVGRIVVPTYANWKDAGRLLATLYEKSPSARDKLRRGLLNDILIALAGVTLGATVITRNGDDFELIRRIKSFPLEVV
jgi:predicted nucleic acid-binding protein